jgi:EAL domain-containing protein (putative c-di-GMP-specific phosphodiesterase class I)
LFNQPFIVDGSQQVVSSTMGFVALCDVDGSGADALKNASIALNRAKSGDRGGYSFYERSMGIELRERVRLLHDLRAAFDHERLFLNYQPQIDLKSERVIGAEALIRWKTDAGAFIPPQRFISLAESSGLIVNIGEWVLRSACHQQARLEREGFQGFRMAINVAAMQFRHPQFLAMLDSALADTGAAAQNIELEITESAAMLDTADMVSLLNAIKARGVTVAIDDFGTGFSSLSYLQQLNIDRIKIDRSFVNQMTTPTAGGQSIAQMITELGCNLGLTVIAEGVETPWQASTLRDLGCHEAQGYLFAKPMLGSELSCWLAAHPMLPAA